MKARYAIAMALVWLVFAAPAVALPRDDQWRSPFLSEPMARRAANHFIRIEALSETAPSYSIGSCTRAGRLVMDCRYALSWHAMLPDCRGTIRLRLVWIRDYGRSITWQVHRPFDCHEWPGQYRTIR